MTTLERPTASESAHSGYMRGREIIQHTATMDEKQQLWDVYGVTIA